MTYLFSAKVHRKFSVVRSGLPLFELIPVAKIFHRIRREKAFFIRKIRPDEYKSALYVYLE